MVIAESFKPLIPDYRSSTERPWIGISASVHKRISDLS